MGSLEVFALTAGLGEKIESACLALTSHKPGKCFMKICLASQTTGQPDSWLDALVVWWRDVGIQQQGFILATYNPGASNDLPLITHRV